MPKILHSLLPKSLHFWLPFTLFALFVTQLYSKNYNKALQRSATRVSEMFAEHRSSGIGGFSPTAASAARPRRNLYTKWKSRKGRRS